MKREECPVDENIVRAICSPHHYDPQEKRLSPSLFDKRGGTSVSRLKIISLEAHWDLFRKELETPPQKLELIGEISVGRLIEIGKNYIEGTPEKPKARPTELSVEIDPTDWNPAHAEIPQPITRGLSNKILPELRLHHSTETNTAV